MSIRSCILGHQAAGEVDEGRARAALDFMDELTAENRGRMAAADAEAAAARQAADALAREAARRRMLTLKQAQTAVELRRRLEAGGDNPGRAALAVLARDMTERNPGANVETRARSVLGLLHGRAEATLEALFPRAGLIRDRALEREVVRELFGEDSGSPAAKAAAKGWSDAAEYARQRANAAGMDIAKRIDWGLPQSHDAIRVGAVPFEEWAGFIRPRLDRAEMLDPATGGAISDMRLETVLRDAWEAIRTNGLARMTPGAFGMKSLANRRGEARVFVFRDARTWLEYQERFGKADIFATMTGHLEDMAREIALLEVLGPNPNASLRFMQDSIRLKAAGTVGDEAQRQAAVERAGGYVEAIQRTYDELTGRNAIPANGMVARGFQSLQNVLTAAQLGAAAVSSVTDLATQRMARLYNGLPAVSRALPELFRLMNPLDRSDQRLAARLAFGAENWASAAIAQQRYAMDPLGARWSGIFADVVLRVSGLSPWTQAGRWAFAMDFAGHLADFVGRPFERIPLPTRQALARYGVGADQWARIRPEHVLEERGASYLNLRALDAADRELANRVSQLVLTEMEFAVPSGGARVRAQLRGGTRPGTFAGEIMRSIAMYKSFPLTVVHTHVMRGLSQASPAKKGQYLAQLAISTTIMGALAMQAKQMTRGRDPQDMSEPKFWGAAVVQGGGLGIFGDFLFADTNRFGGSAVATAAGPIAGFAEDVLRLTQGNVAQAITGEETNFGREAARFAERYTPGGSLWYSRLAVERLLFDELQKAVDADAPEAFRREERRAMKERGQRYWWRPGRAAPSRAPDLEAAIGG